MKVETTDLQSIKTFAARNEVTPSYIYKLIKENKMQAVVIDGVQFVDIKKFPKLPTK